MSKAFVRLNLSSVVLAIGALLVVAGGFGRSFFLRSLLLPTPLPPLLILHGVLASLWTALLLLQATLIARRRRELHIGFGLVGVLLIPLLAGTGSAVLIGAVARQTAIASVGGLMLSIAFDGLHLIVFVALASIAIALRRQASLHRPLLLLATTNLLPPALGRLFALLKAPDVEILVLFSIVILVIAIVGFELAREGRVRAGVVSAACTTLAATLLTWLAQALG